MRIGLAWTWVWMGIAVWPMAMLWGDVVPHAYPLFPLAVLVVFSLSTYLTARLAHARAGAIQIAGGVLGALSGNLIGVGMLMYLVNSRLVPLFVGHLPNVYLAEEIGAAVLLSLDWALGLRLLLRRTADAKTRVLLVAMCLPSIALWLAVLTGITLPSGDPWLYRWPQEVSSGIEFEALFGVPAAAFGAVLALKLTGVREREQDAGP